MFATKKDDTSTSKNDEDILIIADEESNDNTEETIEFSFDDDAVTTPPVDSSLEVIAPVEESVLILDEAQTDNNSEAKLVADKSLELVTEEVNDSPLIDTSLDLGIDLSVDSETEGKGEPAEEPNVVDPQEEFTLNFNDSLSSADESTPDTEKNTETASIEDSKKEEESSLISLEDDSSTTSSDDSSTGDDGSMNDILSATIAKLEARKTLIASEKESKLTHEAEIKKQIKALEEEHADIEAELGVLDNESQKISSNITELENMKLDPVKDHNAKRAKK